MPKKKVQGRSTFDLVDEVLSVAPTKAIPVVTETDTDELSVAKHIQKALGTRNTVIISTPMLKKNKIPSTSTCLQLGYILTYLMPDHWLLTTTDYVKNRQTFD